MSHPRAVIANRGWAVGGSGGRLGWRILLVGVLLLSSVTGLLLHRYADRPRPAATDIVVVQGDEPTRLLPFAAAYPAQPDPPGTSPPRVEAPNFTRWVDDGGRTDPLLASLLATAPIDVVMQHKLLGMQLRESRTPADETRLLALLDHIMPGEAKRSALRILCTATMCEVAGSAAITPSRIADAIARPDAGPSAFEPGPSASGLLSDNTPGFVMYLPRLP